MLNKEFRRSILERLWKPVIIAALLGTIVVAWRHYRHAVSATSEANSLIRSLAESESGANRNSSQIRVALFDANLDEGSATKDLKRLLDVEPSFRWRTVSAADVATGALQEFDVVIFPGGSAPKQSQALAEAGKLAVREYVQSGGGYVGICGGAFLATAKYDWGMALVNAKPLTGEIDIPGKGIVSITARGVGIVKMELTDAGMRILGDSPGLLAVRFSGGPILSPGSISGLPEYVSLAEFRTEVWEYEPQRGTMIDTPAIVAARFGKGRVIIFSPHPEMTKGLESLVNQAILATARRPSVYSDP